MAFLVFNLQGFHSKTSRPLKRFISEKWINSFAFLGAVDIFSYHSPLPRPGPLLQQWTELYCPDDNISHPPRRQQTLDTRQAGWGRRASHTRQPRWRGWGNYLISFSIFVHRISGVCWSSKGITECCESNKKVSRLGRKVLQEFSESGRRLAAIKHPFGRFSQELWSPVSQRVRADVPAVGRQPRPSCDHSPGHAKLQQHARSSVSGQTRPNAY